MSNALRVSVVAGGIALGLAYALSPLTIVFVVVAVALCAAAVKGLPLPERRVIVLMLSAAIALRLLALAALFFGSDHENVVSFFWDGDGKYLKLRGIWIRDVWLGLPMDSATVNEAFSRAYGWTTYLYVIAYVQYLVGRAPYAIHLFNAALFMGTVVLLHRIARQAYGPYAALLGLGLLLFLPTPFMWSISALKESLYVFLEVCAMLAAIVLVQWKQLPIKVLWKRLAIGAVALGALPLAVWANADVRGGAAQIMVAAVAVGVVGSLMASEFMGSVAMRRLSLAVLILVSMPVVAYRVVNRPDVQARVMAQLKVSAVQHIGHVHTEGNSYRLLDQRFYSAPPTGPGTIESMTPIEGARFAARAFLAFVLVPFPWQVRSLQEMLFLPQQLVWYFLVVFGVFGFVAGLRRNAAVTCLLAGFAAAGGLAIALNSGNVGTLVRHRDTIVPFVVWLSALGIVDVLARLVDYGARSARSKPVIEARAACH